MPLLPRSKKPRPELERLIDDRKDLFRVIRRQSRHIWGLYLMLMLAVSGLTYYSVTNQKETQLLSPDLWGRLQIAKGIPLDEPAPTIQKYVTYVAIERFIRDARALHGDAELQPNDWRRAMFVARGACRKQLTNYWDETDPVNAVRTTRVKVTVDPKILRLSSTSWRFRWQETHVSFAGEPTAIRYYEGVFQVARELPHRSAKAESLAPLGIYCINSEITEVNDANFKLASG